MKKLFLIDAYAMIFRAYYALMRSPRYTSDGVNTSAIFGFVNTLQDILKKENPTHIAVCFDPKEGTFRHEMYAEYKAQREATPEDIINAVPFIKQIIEAYRIPIYEVAGYEADDVIATLAHEGEQNGFDVYMMTPDKDFGQLVTEHIRQYKPPYAGSDFEVLGIQEVCQKHGIDTPLQVIDILSLMGDAVDNIPGCPGVGKVTAAKLIKQFGSVENLLEHTDQIKGALRKKVEDNVDKIRLSKMLATIKQDVPIVFDEETLRRKPLNGEAMKNVCLRLEFRTLLSRILSTNEVDSSISVDVIKDKPTAQKGAPQQLALFDNMADSLADSQPKSIEFKPIKTLESEQEINGMVEEILKEKRRFAYSLITDKSDVSAMEMTVLAVAVSTDDKSFYIPLEGGSDASLGSLFAVSTPQIGGLSQLKALFESNGLLKISDRIKQDIVLLRRNGISLQDPYFDTEIAHYLIAPEQPHGYAILMENGFAKEITALVSPKKNSNEMMPTQNVSQWSGERTQSLLLLKDWLEGQVNDLGMGKLLNEVELPLARVLADMEYNGVRINRAGLKSFSASMSERCRELDRECQQLAGVEFNTASPAQVGEVLFDKLRLDDKAKRSKSGKYSTTEEILSHLVDRHEIVGKILQLRGLRKLLSTYIDVLPQLVNPITGRIHCTFNQTVTATGRLSCTNPNLQNIPVRDENSQQIRACFIPEQGNVFFSADYSQIELRLVADMSGDETMITAFRDGSDVHRATAAHIYHIPIAEVTLTQRRHAKTANFGILYGISAFGLAEQLKISRTEAKQLIDDYYKAFPTLKDYIERCVQNAREKGYVSTLMGRRRQLPDINSRNAVVRSFSERNAVNAPIQGTAADIIKVAMVGIYREFQKRGLKSKMIMQVHDELNFDVVPDELPMVEQIVVEQMQNAYQGKVPLEVSHSSGANWLEAH